MNETPSEIEADQQPARGFAEARLLLVVCQAASILITWPLWSARGGMLPNLPVLEWSALGWLNVDCQWLLLGSLGLVLFRPLWGMIVHSGLLILAIGLDQMRIQPEFVSLAILLWGTTGKLPALFLARAHLVALWFLAGLHKLLSPDYWNDSGPQNFQETFPGTSLNVAVWLAALVAAGELLIGVLALIPRARQPVSWLACLLHGGILYSLLIRNWNHAVWPWNLALAFAGFTFFWNWREPSWHSSRDLARRWTVAAVLVLLSPALYYIDRLDAYLCHCVYSSNTPIAVIFNRQGESEYLSNRSFATLNVPFPPAHRLFEQYFRKVGQPGEVLEIEDPRWWAKRRGYSLRAIEAPGEEENEDPPL